jgi:DNA gyrase inhibitor GyrI
MLQDEAKEIQHSKLVITAEMIEAGARALSDYDRDSESLSEAAERVFRAMLAASR